MSLVIFRLDTMYTMSEVDAYYAPLVVSPPPDPPSRWEVPQAASISREFIKHEGDPDAQAQWLTNYIFGHYPMFLDLPPAVNYRFQEAGRAAARHPVGRERVIKSILTHLEEAGKRFEQGYTLVTSINPAPERLNGDGAQRVYLPDRMRSRALVWNAWAQEMIRSGRINDLFGHDPQWVGVKLADGTWLPAGNLMIEVTQGIGRIQTPAHQIQDLNYRWGFGVGDRGEWVDLDRFVIMTHIADKGLLRLADQIGKAAGLEIIEGMKLTPAVYVRAYPEILDLMRHNSSLHIHDVLSDATWIYNPKLEDLFPRHEVARLHRVAGDVVIVGTAEEMDMPAQVRFATLNPERKVAFEAGTFRVDIASRRIRDSEMVEVTKEYGDEIALERLREIEAERR